MPDAYDAVVVGAGPNGLSAAVELARNGKSVLVLEAAEAIGGGIRTAELTLPGFRHDVCSAIHPMGLASPFFRSLPLESHGLEWMHPEIALAHPLDDGTAMAVYRSIEATAETLGVDERAYKRLFSSFDRRAESLVEGFLAPLLRIPKHPFVMARFGMYGIRSAEKLLRSRFAGDRTRALLAGNAAHGMLPLSAPLTGGLALLYNILAHHVGWPVPKGGSQAIADSLVSYLRTLGGDIRTNAKVTSLADVPPSRVVLFDTSPKALIEIAGAELPLRYVRKLERFRYGAGVFKIDWALSEPIPWKASDAARAGCLHVGGSFEEIAASEDAVAKGQHSDKPWVIVAQQSVVDSSRAPRGKHTAWGYAHVPSGSSVDMTTVIEDQIERFAPGFKDVVLARSTKTAVQEESYNPNYVGGDISSGATTLQQMLRRPVLRMEPYATPNKRLFLCSQSTPPGPGVHGMCGYFAARAALKRL